MVTGSNPVDRISKEIMDMTINPSKVEETLSKEAGGVGTGQRAPETDILTHVDMIVLATVSVTEAHDGEDEEVVEDHILNLP